jgi:hypothetical protein
MDTSFSGWQPLELIEYSYQKGATFVAPFFSACADREEWMFYIHKKALLFEKEGVHKKE